MPDQDDWKWHYSYLVGIMYGPVPVGIIVVAVAGVFYLATL